MYANFGKNVRFRPRLLEEPRSEADVVALLERCGGRRVRAVGSLHSWSDIVEAEDVMVDLSALDSIVYFRGRTGEDPEVRVGGGCTLERLLHVLDTDHGATLPAIGGVTRQTVAGAIATGTHGSGQHSISHHVTGVDIATREGGRAVIKTLALGDPLKAARCHLGRLGLVVSVRLRCVRQYFVREHVRRHDAIEDVLAQRDAEPLQYFVWLPHDWRWVAFHRHVAGCRPSLRERVRAALRRAFRFIAVDHGFHLFMTIFDPVLNRPSLLRWLYRVATPTLLLRKRPVIDRSDRALTLAHHLYRHVELELAIPADRIVRASALIRYVTDVFAGRCGVPPEGVAETLGALGLDAELEHHAGTFTLNYPLSFRLVLTDDTLLSQSSKGPVYTVSFFSYAREREAFERYTTFMTRCLVRAYDARPHFGKLFHVDGDTVDALYAPARDAFVGVAAGVDPEGLFRNAFTDEVLDEGRADAQAQPDAAAG